MTVSYCVIDQAGIQRVSSGEAQLSRPGRDGLLRNSRFLAKIQAGHGGNLIQK
jgi:hypothetical protein